eukprot:s5101_g9.t1
MALRGAVMKNLPSTISFRSRAWLQWLGFEATIPGSPLAAKGTSKDTGWLASAFLALLICLAIAAFCWMQRRERIVEQYAEEESRMRNTIAEAQLPDMSASIKPSGSKEHVGKQQCLI